MSILYLAYTNLKQKQTKNRKKKISPTNARFTIYVNVYNLKTM